MSSNKRNPEFRKKIVKPPGLKFIKLAIHSFTLPSGTVGRWESIYNPSPTSSVLVLGLTPENKILLIHIFRFPVEDWVYELPGGMVNKFETPAKAAQRELLEETGYATNQPLELLTSGYIFTGKANEFTQVFLARDCRWAKEPERDEVEKYAGLTVVKKDPRTIIGEIADGSRSYDPILNQSILALIGKGYFQV